MMIRLAQADRDKRRFVNNPRMRLGRIDPTIASTMTYRALRFSTALRTRPTVGKLVDGGMVLYKLSTEDHLWPRFISVPIDKTAFSPSTPLITRYGQRST